MKKAILLLVAISFTSCGAIMQRQAEFLASPQGQIYAQRQFTLDSIRASRTDYNYGNYNGYRIDYNRGFNYNYNRFNRGLHYYYTPNGVKVIYRIDRFGNNVIISRTPQKGFRRAKHFRNNRNSAVKSKRARTRKKN